MTQTLTLGQEQEAFSRDLHKLLGKAFELGFEIRMGEVLRTPEQQALYLRESKSKTSNSMHLKKCAVDLNLFRAGVLCGKKEIQALGTYWESLNGKNQWGGNWITLVDTPHFERTV